jgi:hypothetical protein
VSLIQTNRTTAGMAAIGARAKDAAAQAVPMGKRAGTTAVQGARQGVQGAKEWAAPRMHDAVRSAQEWATPRVQDAVRGTREWAAPRLESAADAVDTSVAPAVSSALRSAASQIRPEKPAKTGLRRLIDWRWLAGLGAVAAAAGASAAVAMRRRYTSATAAAEEATEPDAQAPSDGSDAGAAARSEVNGQVTTPRQ